MPNHELQINRPYPKQKEILTKILEPHDGAPLQIDLCCGRGFGKTVLAIVTACKVLSLDHKMVGLFLEPNRDDLNKIFLKNWREIVPKELYSINKTEKTITWANGAILFYGIRNITGSKDEMRNKYRGFNLNFVIDDEAAMGFDAEQYTNTLAAIRRKSPHNFYFTISTPLVGPYKNMITSPEHILYRGTSRDNPHLPAGFVDKLLANMSKDQAKREIYGEFISLEGRIWRGVDTEKNWPNGNINNIHKTFDPSKPWWLFCDLGSATGAYVVVQRTTSMYRGTTLYNRAPVWVACADYCSDNDASASRAFQLLKSKFGVPAAVVAGKDVNTKDRSSGYSVAHYVQEIFGNVNVLTCDEDFASRQVQYDLFSSLICTVSGLRRFTIAKDYIELDPDSLRGVNQMFEQDEWPPLDKRKEGEFLPKGNAYPVCHVRDALLMGTKMIMNTTTHTFKKDPTG